MDTYDFDGPFWQNRFLAIDSRKLISPKDSLFFALSGHKHDGHAFLTELYEKGVRRFVVSRAEAGKVLPPDAEVVCTPEPIRLMQQLVEHKRKAFQNPVIGITGSNGKTIVKEWLYLLLEADFSIIKSPKSYNSQIGVPLSVWPIGSDYNFGIFEVGISKRGEMEALAKIVSPTIGIFTNIGQAHDEGFASRAEKAAEKARLFSSAAQVVCCSEHTIVVNTLQEANCPTYQWGKSANAQLKVLSQNNGDLALVDRQGSAHISLPFSDPASVENAMHCIAVLRIFGYEWSEIQRRIKVLNHLPMRLAVLQGDNQCLIVDDTYSNDLLGLGLALDFLNQHTPKEKRATLIASEVRHGQEAYGKMAELVIGKGINRFVGVGDFPKYFKDTLLDIDQCFFANTEQLLTAIRQGSLTFTKENLLVKGARVFALERVVRQLTNKLHGTRLEVNLDAMAHNLSVYRQLLKKDTKVMVMLKAMGYGSGTHEIGSFLQYDLVDYFGVAYVDEGRDLRKHGIRTPIMVLSPQIEALQGLVDFNLEPEVYSFRQLTALLAFLENHSTKTQQPFPIHINIDTGMHRQGFHPEKMAQLAEILSAHPEVTVGSVFSHLAAADDPLAHKFSQKQFDTFSKAADVLCQKLGYTPMRHILNSAGIGRYPEWQLDMVRLGIGLYGVDPNRQIQSSLQSVSSLKTNISQIIQVKAGETVGYGQKGKVHEDTQIATLAIGYADGFGRQLGNGKGQVLINGQKTPTIGSICMDMCMVDLGKVNATEGDEAIVFGEQLPVQLLAETLSTIPYEILTSIGNRVKRVFYAG